MPERRTPGGRLPRTLAEFRRDVEEGIRGIETELALRRPAPLRRAEIERLRDDAARILAEVEAGGEDAWETLSTGRSQELAHLLDRLAPFRSLRRRSRRRSGGSQDH